MPPEETAVPATTVAPMTEPPKSGKTVVGLAWPTESFQVGDIVVEAAGTELSAADAKTVLAAAEANDVKLVTIKEVSE